MSEEKEEKEKKLILQLGKYQKGRGRPFKIVLSKSKDGDMKMELEGSDALQTAMLFTFLEIAKKGAKIVSDKIDEISRKIESK